MAVVAPLLRLGNGDLRDVEEEGETDSQMAAKIRLAIFREWLRDDDAFAAATASPTRGGCPMLGPAGRTKGIA